MNQTTIDYLTHTWSPIAMKCTRVGPGCQHCWHLRRCKRMAKMPQFSPEIRATYAGTGPPVLVPSRLGEPLKRKKPARIGVQFMGDLMHKDIPDDFIFDILTVIADCPQHTFLVLTKRPKRMAHMWKRAKIDAYPNLQLGVSAENQATADERTTQLLATPAALHYLSLEPLLEEVDIEKYLISCEGCDNQGSTAYVGHRAPGDGLNLCRDACQKGGEGPSVSWVIVGGETGPGARPMDPAWVRRIRDDCLEADVKFFFKGWGDWLPYDHDPESPKFGIAPDYHADPDAGYSWRKVSKARAGHLLDGKEWREYPE